MRVNEIRETKEMIYDIWVEGTKPHGYDIDEVYGLISSCWNGTLKKVS